MTDQYVTEEHLENSFLKSCQKERETSDMRYAEKKYEKAVIWTVLAIAGGVILGVANIATGSLISHLQPSSISTEIQR